MGFFRIPDPEGLTSNFFHLSLLLLFLDPGSGMGKNPQHCFLDHKTIFRRQFGSRIRDVKKSDPG
jgi:hypothetical protein